MKKKLFRPTILSGLVAAIAWPAVHAQTTGTGTLETVTVTSQKRKENVQQVPLSISVISGAQLQENHVYDITDFTRMVPNVSFSSQGGLGLATLEIRGVSSQAGSATVSVYLDDVSLTTRNIYSQGAAEPRFFDIERVEVLRGPQGTLYGEGSFGGVINIISKRPNAQKFEAGASATWFEIEDGGSGSSDINAMINVPLIKDKFAARLVGYRSDHDGYIDGYDVLPVFLGEGPPTLVAEEVNTEEVTGGRLSLGYTGDNFDATLIL